MSPLVVTLWIAALINLAAIAVVDARRRIIPNEMVLVTMAAGIALRLSPGGGSLWLSTLGAALIFLILGVIAHFGAIGGGDVKLISAASLLVSVNHVGSLLLDVSMAGGVLSAIYVVARLARRAGARLQASSCGSRESGRRKRDHGGQLQWHPSLWIGGFHRHDILFGGRSASMFVRNFLLVLGALASIAGIALLAIWLNQPNSETEKAAVPTKEILVAARPLTRGSLLRDEDLAWKVVPADSAPPDGYVRGQITTAALAGAGLRQDLRVGDAVIASALIGPADRGFLAAVLLPGDRAITIAVDAPESASGLLMPGDHVDIILTQNFNDLDASSGHRSVGETVLRDLRVIALDQTVSPAPPSGPLQQRVGAESRIPKTITLEVSEQDAEKLLVAMQLGKVELAIRAVEPTQTAQPLASSSMPIWASDVSPALLALGAKRPGAAAPGAEAGKTAAPIGIEIMRGEKVEMR